MGSTSGATFAEARALPPGEPNAISWFALYTAPRHEKRLVQQLEQRSISCFLPLYRSMRRWKDRRKVLDLVLFPGYVFVRIALENKLRVLRLPGALRLVTFNGRPAALPDDEVESLRNRLAGSAKVEPHPYLRAGRRVRVREGPMSGLEGIVVRRKESCRVVFSIELIQRSVAVEVDEADLVPA
jgi:transcription antitermination factor NusG